MITTIQAVEAGAVMPPTAEVVAVEMEAVGENEKITPRSCGWQFKELLI